MMKKKVLALILTASVTVSVISGCGAVSKINEIKSTAEGIKEIAQLLDDVKNESLNETSEEYDSIGDEVVALWSKIESIPSGTTDESSLAEESGIKGQDTADYDVSDYNADDYYTTREFWEKFNDKLEEFYQEDLAAGIDVVPTRMADTPDGLELVYDLTFTLDKESCDPSDDYEGFISQLARDFYAIYEDYFIELLAEDSGTVTYDVYVIYRDIEW